MPGHPEVPGRCGAACTGFGGAALRERFACTLSTVSKVSVVHMATFLAIAVGGAVGAVLRHAATAGLYHWLGAGFPWGTLAVNLLGSLTLGVFQEAGASTLKLTPELRSLVATGLLGAFTTFSTFALDAASLFDRPAPLAATLYIGTSISLCIGAFYLGANGVRWILS